MVWISLWPPGWGQSTVVFQVKQRATSFGDGSLASGLNGGSHSGGSRASPAGTTIVIRSAFRDRSSLLAWDANPVCPPSPGWTGDVRCADLRFVAGLSGQQPRPIHRSSADVCRGFAFSGSRSSSFAFNAIAVPVPAIMASATTQPAIIFMTWSSQAATLSPPSSKAVIAITKRRFAPAYHA
jgi:hypothetical protein